MLSRFLDLDTLDSFYFENQTWRALHKAWKGFVIAKNKYEVDRMLLPCDSYSEIAKGT